MWQLCFLTVHDSPKVKERLQILRSVLAAFMLRRTKSKLMECGSLVLPPLTETTVYVVLVLIRYYLGLFNTHATDWLSRWIWSLSMVHHRTASKKIFLHVQRKYIRVSCNLSIRSKSDLRTFDNGYLIINFLQVLLPKITLRI